MKQGFPVPILYAMKGFAPLNCPFGLHLGGRKIKKIGTENAKKRENALQGHCEAYTEKTRFWNTIWSAAKVFQNRVSIF